MNEQYYFDGPYREFRGYQFWNRKPVTILDKATLEEIKKDASFKKYEPPVDTPPPQRQETAAEVSFEPCPKCGRSIGRGRTMHVKFCKG